MNGSAVIPLRITPEATRDVVLDDLMAQLAELQSLLKGLQSAPAAVPASSPIDALT
jgi:hypothetical protein